jgi:membrane protein
MLRRGLRLPVLLKQAFAGALAHDALNLAQSSAYSAMVALFPALVVAGAVVALLPDAAPLKIEVGGFFDQVLPAPVFPLLTGYFVNSTVHTNRVLGLAALVSVSGASSVLATLMEGLRRAAHLPRNAWSFWERRLRALLLVPLSLLPLVIATLLVMFGRWMMMWIAANVWTDARPILFAVALALRWIISLAGVAAAMALVYHIGTPADIPTRQRADALEPPAEPAPRRWAEVIPGAIVATSIWFTTTLIFGWYVTRVANYSLVYGSLGAGIALLLWLYFVFFSVLVGSEFNAQIDRQIDRQPKHQPDRPR